MTPTTTPPAAGIQDAARHLAEARTDEAVAVLERLAADFPAYVTAHVLLAKAYDANGRTGDALEAWHRAYFLMPGSPLIVRERTRLLRIAPFTAEFATTEAATAEPEEPLAVEPVDASADEEEEVAVSEEEQADELDPSEPEPFEPVAAEPAVEAALLTGEADDLDTLIQQLENAPRLRPDLNFKDEAGEVDEVDEDEVVSETLARIYEAQKQYEAAARIYEQLADEHPDRAAELRSKAAEMRRLADGAGS